MKVLDCILDAHDPWLVTLAALVCALSCLTAIELLRHAQGERRYSQVSWIFVAACAGGSGIWATHFIAMLAFDRRLQSAYELDMAALSLLYAVILSGLGFAIGLAGGRAYRLLGGLVVGLGIAVMHFVGMHAFEVAARLQWDGPLVVTALAIGLGAGGAALAVGLGRARIANRLAGAALLFVAICGLHFVAMGAVEITPDPSIAIAPDALPRSALAVAVALATFAILLLAAAAVLLDIRARRRQALETGLRSLADAAVEGLLICKGERIVNANQSFATLTNVPAAALAGASLAEYLAPAALKAALEAQPGRLVETEMRCAGGSLLPVELITHPVAYAEEPHLAIAVRDLRARRSAERQIHFLAHHDPLTGLANRTTFNDRLDGEIARAGAAGTRFAVLCLDLDRFKDVNDLFGHAVGDSLLASVARLVTGALGEGEFMARLGGDEFAALARVTSADAAGRLAERILAATREAGAAPGGIDVGVSIGIALFPDDAEDRVTLFNHADTALYRAKAEGRDTFRFYEARMGEALRDRRLIEHDLRQAVARGEMELHYQPQTDVAAGTVTGFEALLRWRHPVRGSVSPGLFVPIAEESGLVIEIGTWVLREACREAASWRNPLSVAVNVSAVQIHAPSFLQILETCLDETGLDPGRLQIEITETALIRDPARALSTLRQVKAVGVRIAMDDFGTGYSSLSNLRTFPFDEIKIDGSFVRAVDRNPQAAAIVRAVVGLGRGLDLRVLAEGVEEEAELSFLRSEKCAAAQGYLIGRPAPIARFAHLTHAADPVPAMQRVA